MTSRIYPCKLIAIACDKYIQGLDELREEYKKEWIKKYSYYTKGFWIFKEVWERDLKSTKYYLDRQLIQDDMVSYYQYYDQCIHIGKNEQIVRKMRKMANSKGSDSVMAVDLNDFNLIDVYYTMEK